MPRSGRFRTFISEYKESPRLEKASFIPPFIILIIECILLIHAIIYNDVFVLLLTMSLLAISIVEIILVSLEIHDRFKISNYDRVLTIKLDDFITEKKEKNLKKIVNDFILKYPDYENTRNVVYHTACQILETHAEENWEKELSDKLDKIIKKKKKQNVDEILESFIKKFPNYKKQINRVYEELCKKLAS